MSTVASDHVQSATKAEDQVLLLCARQEMSLDLINRAKELLQTSLDWAQLIEMAWRHGVSSLLHRHLSSLVLERFVPNEFKDVLRQSYVRAAFRSQTHFAAITQLLHEYETRKLAVILLKGAALSLTTYCDRALRPFADIDLLIRETDIDAAKDALAACGYSLGPELTSEKLSRRFHVNLPFARPGDRPVHVELHWRLTDRFSSYSFPENELWQRARRIAIGETTALVLELHDTLIYLAAHLDKHGYLNQTLAARDDAARWVIDELSANRLIWFTDLHELITANPVDWQLIETRCGRGELRDAVSSTLALLRALLGTEVPAAMMPHNGARLPKRAIKRIAEFASATDQRREFFRRHILATRKGFELRLVRLSDLWSFIFPRDGGSIAHSAAAVGKCLKLSVALSAARLRNFAKHRL